MGLEVARAVLESGGDVICLDCRDKAPEDEWSKSFSLSLKFLHLI